MVRGDFHQAQLVDIPEATRMQQSGRTWSADEEEGVKTRLRDLGYMA